MRQFFFGLLLLLACSALAQDQPAAPAPEAKADTPKTRVAPEAKTQEELDAYMAALGVKDPQAAEAAADDFARKFPESELRAGLYRGIMQQYQAADKPERTIALGRKTLSIDPDDTIAQIVTANTLSESTSEKAPDRDAAFADAMRFAQAGLNGIDANLLTTNMTPDQVNALRSALIFSAHASMGLVESKRKNWVEAEKHLQAAIASTPQQDPTTLMRLAIAQDNLQKYNDALATINKAIAAADAQHNGIVGAAAREHKKRLVMVAANPPKKTTKTAKK